MKTLKLTAVMLTAILLSFFSCTKEDTPTICPPDTSSEAYFPLQASNYWVYSVDLFDDSNQFIRHLRLDSIYVAHDTVINDTLFSIVNGVRVWGQPYRDYLAHLDGNLIRPGGYVFLSESLIGDTLDTVSYDGTPYSSISVLEEKKEVSVPVGTYDCLNLKNYVIRRDSDGQVVSQSELDHLYAPNVGKVFDEVMYMGSKHRIKRELIRYHIAE